MEIYSSSCSSLQFGQLLCWRQWQMWFLFLHSHVYKIEAWIYSFHKLMLTYCQILCWHESA